MFNKLKRVIVRYPEIPITLALMLTVVVVYHVRNRGKLMEGNLLEKVESPYSSISVYQTKDGLRHMVFGYRHMRYFESVDNPKDPNDLEIGYTRLLTVSLLYSNSDPASILSIGMGGGKVSSYLLGAMPQARVTEVELDPDVVMLAKKYFDYQDLPHRTVVVDDGRKFLMHSQTMYDLIVLDAYRGPFVPFHLLTEQFYGEVKKHLNPGGIVAVNIDSVTALSNSTLATLQQVFQHTECYHVDGNTVTIAYDGPAKTSDELSRRARQLDDQYHFRYPLTAMLEGRTVPPAQTGVAPLTDDFAPVDSLNAIDAHNAKLK
jgi:spermidine synthase